MFWYNLLQVTAILILLEGVDGNTFQNKDEKIFFCLLVIFPIIPIIIYVGYLIYSLFKKK